MAFLIELQVLRFSTFNCINFSGTHTASWTACVSTLTSAPPILSLAAAKQDSAEYTKSPEGIQTSSPSSPPTTYAVQVHLLLTIISSDSCWPVDTKSNHWDCCCDLKGWLWLKEIFKKLKLLKTIEINFYTHKIHTSYRTDNLNMFKKT